MRKNLHTGNNRLTRGYRRLGQRVGSNSRVRVLLACAGVVLLFAVVGIVTASASQPTSLPSAKATVLARQAQAIATARARHPTKPANVSPPAPEPTATLTAGIFPTHQGPFSNSTFSVEDMYRGPVGSQWEIVFAGTAWTDYPTEGVGALRVYTITGDLIGAFNAPDHSSYLDITGIRGTTLQLQSDKSSSLTFDLATNLFGA
jgi:hypothetical protein